MSHKQRKHHKYDSAPWDLTLVGCLLSGRKMFLVKKKKSLTVIILVSFH